MCIAAAIAGAGVVTAGAGLIGASDAAGAEEDASNNATAVQENMFNATQANEQPFVAGGTNALQALMKGLGIGPGGTGTGPLNAPFNPADLSATPGYRFTQQQGEQGLVDEASAVGGVGGNVLKELAQYNTGLASNTFQQQFQDYLAQQQQGYNELSGVVSQGQASAGNLAANSTQVGSNIGSNIIGAGNASAAGTIGATNAVTGGISSLSSNFLLSQLLNGGGTPTGFSSASLYGS